MRLRLEFGSLQYYIGTRVSFTKIMVTGCLIPQAVLPPPPTITITINYKKKKLLFSVNGANQLYRLQYYYYYFFGNDSNQLFSSF